MSDYISREAAIEAMYKDAEAHPGHTFWTTQHEALLNIPAADVRPVRRGKWKHGVCQTCFFDWSGVAPFAIVPNFCPKCGARMEER